MKECTRLAICALLAVDTEATEDERRMVTDALAGRKVSRPLTYAEAAEMLGCHRNTIPRLVASGRLKVVYGAGGRPRVLAWSAEDYATGRVK